MLDPSPLFFILLATTSSPWSPAEWKITLNFGRERETPSDEGRMRDWGASGARLAFTVPVRVSSDTNPHVQDDFVGRRCDQLRVIPGEEATFVSVRGLERARFAAHPPGAWRLSPRTTGRVAGDAGTLRVILELDDTLTRNDVVVTGPRRLYLSAHVWRSDELPAGRRRLAATRRRYRDAQDAVEARLSHESGDRRLDGTDLLDTAAASVDMAGLVRRRDARRSELREAQTTLPYKDLSAPGAWPGDDQPLIVQEGTIAVKKRTGGLFGIDELVVVGRWTAAPVQEVVTATSDEEDEGEMDDDDEFVECDEEEEAYEEWEYEIPDDAENAGGS